MTNKRQNKFADLLTAAREADDAPASESAPTPAATGTRATPPPQAEPPTLSAPQTEPPPPELSRRGRPATGKRSNPEYEQVTAYIRKETNLQIRLALLQEGNSRDFSDLVEMLLRAWLQDRQ